MMVQIDHCIHGHPFDEINTCVLKGKSAPGKRVCRACCRDRVGRQRKKERIARLSILEDRRRVWTPNVSGVELSWCAGVFEGEGTVTIIKSGRYCRPLVSVTNCDRQMVDAFNRHWPCRILVKPGTETANPAFVWYVNCGWKIEIFLNQIIPFIRTKRVATKMKIVIDSQKGRVQGARDKGYLAKMEVFHEAIRRLNKRGRSSD